MRPNSILLFERLFLGSMAIGVINAFLSWDDTMATLAADPNLAAFGNIFIYATLAFSVGINLLLWFFVARKASTVAKWIIIVFFGIGLVSMPFSIGTLPPLSMIITLAITAMQGAAIYMLFRPDAQKWFAGETVADLEKTFE